MEFILWQYLNVKCVGAVGNNDEGQCDVSDWTDIVAISTGWTLTLGLKNDGTIVATNTSGASAWTDIKLQKNK